VIYFQSPFFNSVLEFARETFFELAYPQHLYDLTAKISRLFESGIPGSEIEQRNAFGIFLNNQSCSFPDI
jgi:hypothetical protein